jgi:hypothetical protein
MPAGPRSQLHVCGKLPLQVPEQQCVSDEHSAPGDLQHRPVPPPVAEQGASEGQWELSVHVPPAGEMHLLPTQVLPTTQQSVQSRQPRPAGLHPHWPLMHAPEQHCEFCVQ